MAVFSGYKVVHCYFSRLRPYLPHRMLYKPLSGLYQWRIQGGSQGSMEPPFGLHLALMIRYEVLIDRLNGTPLSVYRTKKTTGTVMAHLSMLQQKIRSKQIDWTSRIDSFSQKRSKWAGFWPKVGVASEIRAQLYHQNPPSGNPGSATGLVSLARVVEDIIICLNVCFSKLMTSIAIFE